MGTVPFDPEPKPKVIIDPRIEQAVRLVVAGHEYGAIRRIVLYVLLAVALLLAVVVDGALAAVAGAVGTAALLLLALTDKLT